MYLGALAIVLGIALGLLATPARAEIIAYVDHNGRRVFVNTEDKELTQAARQGGAAAALRLMERRKRALPGIEAHIKHVAQRHSIDPELIHAIIEVESTWNPRARSRKGAVGLMQLLPATGRRFGVSDLVNPRQNVAGGVRYLRFLLDRFDGNLELALAAYNAGENAVESAQGVPPYPETRKYLERLRALYAKLGKASLHGTGRILRILDEEGRAVFINE